MNEKGHVYFSQRTGTNPNAAGLPLTEIADLFGKIFLELQEDGYFVEALGYECVDHGTVKGTIKNVDLEILLTVRKKDLWPVEQMATFYSEDDLFDIIEFLNQHVSKPIDGSMHSYGGCGMHWETFNKTEGQREFRNRVNQLLSHYEKRYELSERGEILLRAEPGFERMLAADIPTSNPTVRERIDAAVLRFRRHGSTLDDRRQAVRDFSGCFRVPSTTGAGSSDNERRERPLQHRKQLWNTSSESEAKNCLRRAIMAPLDVLFLSSYSPRSPSKERG